MSANRRVHEEMAERMRERIWEGVKPPVEMLQRALDTMSAKLTAKKRTYLSFQGVKTATIEEDDHDIQLKAARQITEIAGAQVRERDVAPITPKITYRYDPATGVSELIIGDDEQMSPDVSRCLPSDVNQLTLPGEHAVLPDVPPSLQAEASAAPPLDNVIEHEVFERHLVRRGSYDAEFRAKLFDEIKAIEEEDKT